MPVNHVADDPDLIIVGFRYILGPIVSFGFAPSAGEQRRCCRVDASGVILSIEHRGKDWLERNRCRFVVLLVAVMLVGVLLPGNPAWRNALDWSDPGPGVYFGDIGQALSARPIVSRTGELTLEIWLLLVVVPNRGNQEIISFYDDQLLRPLVIGQFHRGFLIRGREDNPEGDPRRDKYIGVDELGLAKPSEVKHLAVTVGQAGARLHVNGKATRLSLPETVARPGEAFGGHLLLGSSDTGWRVWLGSVFGVAVYERVLGPAELLAHAVHPAGVFNPRLSRDKSMLALYRFEEGRGTRTRSAVPLGPELIFPRRMTRPTRPNFLSNNARDLRDLEWLKADIVRNIIGFVPLGLLLAWKKPAGRIWLAVAAGFALSLSIELLQSLIPGRDSSLIDLASNSLGTLVGAVLSRLRGFWHRGPLPANHQ
jgi:hypothetical protein